MARAKRESTGERPPDRIMLSRTLILLLVCGIAAFIVLVSRLYYLQIICHEQLEAAAIEQQLRETRLDSGRGAIYDRNMNVLAMSADAETIYVSPAEIKMYGEDPELIASGLSEILGVDSSKILDMCADTASWYKTVARRVEPDLAQKVRQFKNLHDLKGVKIEADSKRYYPYGSLACHVIGYVGYENTGLSGLELGLNSALKGLAGRVVRVKNAYGTDMLYTKFEDYVEAESGLSAVLTIDSTIQYYVEKHLQQAVEDYAVKNGAAAIAMNVNTGEILAMASLGNFDLNDYQTVGEDAQALITAAPESERQALLSAFQQAMWRNKALSDTYEPGSTFKIITLAMGLEEKVINASSHFYCGGKISVVGDAAGRGRSCWKTQGHGDQSLTQAIQHSCNVALIQIGQRVGAETFYDYVEAFGLFDKTGIELGGEAGSIWWSRELFCDELNQTQLAAASFGQTFNITPLQLVRAISACANGGNLMQPYIVKGLVDEDGNLVEETQPQVIRRVISQETSEEICAILEQVVCDKTEGTGKNAYVAGYRIGGKTGTSTKTVLEAEGTKEYIVSFVGIAPADDPEICILVLLDTPGTESGVYISGGNMAAPTVGKMVADILPYMGIEPVYTEQELDYIDRQVPDISGMTLDQAEKALAERGLKYRLVGSGDRVLDFLPRADSLVANGSEIIIYTDAPAGEQSAQMPGLVGLSYARARELMAECGLFLCTDYAGVIDPETTVITGQLVPEGTAIAVGEVVMVSLADTDTTIYGRY